MKHLPGPGKLAGWHRRQFMPESLASVLFRSNPVHSEAAEFRIIAEHGPALPFASCVYNGADGQWDDG